MNEIRQHLEKNFSSYEMKILHYTALCFLYESTKFIAMFFFFSFFHLQKEFCIEIFILLSIRSFYGGLHFDHYTSCFAFTFAFCAAGLFLAGQVTLSHIYEIILLLSALTVSYFIKPIASKSRAERSEKQEKRCHIAGFMIVLLYSVLLLTLRTFPYRNIILWVIVLQTMQLIAAKIQTKGADHK